ncbi:uncharacterized protein Dana_GF16646 [Drosophila ananassae]|uniref:EF-hand domain-containing protein n=1 Tax=Drosophila ananassae TaxID=7217 RepID=B3M0W7_DROAN|nr:uncharacterized protein LOC6499440 isoform X2 [Drosophila ananassae]EDV43196.1 uncharacterized protein Dana_GF16646 [Drosophila ananassae]
MDNLDSTIDTMENSRFGAIYGGLIKDLAISSNMTPMEVNCLLMIYYKFAKVNGPGAKQMVKKQFYQLYLVLFNVANVQIIERTLLAITKDTKFVSPQAWISLFNLYITKDINVRMRFAFDVYDTKGTGVIDREQVGVACDKFFYGEDEDELNELKADMTEFIMKKFDIDKDGVISFEDYSSVVSQQPILVEFLGWLFPSRNDKDLMAHCINFDTILNVMDNS